MRLSTSIMDFPPRHDPRKPPAEPTSMAGGRGAFLLAVFASAAGAGLLALTNGSPVVIPALCVGVALLVVFVQRLEFGIYILLGTALLVEQYQIFGIHDIVTAKIPFYLNLNLITGVKPLVFNPVELVLGLMVGCWFLRATISREWSLVRVPNLGVAALFLVMLIVFTAYGLARGGDWKVSLWEIRALYYLCGSYLITTQIIRTRRQVQICVWIVIVMTAIKGCQGCWRYVVTLHGNLTGIRAIVGHEDALFITTVFLLGLSFLLLRYRGKELWLIALSLPMTFATYIWAQRRITFGTLGISILIMVAMLPAERRRNAIKSMAPFALLFMVYLAAFWNVERGGIAMPAQKIKSVFVEKKGTEDESSNFYRKAELVNLRQTLHDHPLGIGFGNKYEIIMPLDRIDFPLWEYIPHNCIYWMWVKTGFIGFTIFWLFFGVAIIQAVVDYRAMRDAYFKSLAMMALLFIVSQVIVAYYDLQIVFFRNMLYLGIVMALAVSVRRIEAEEQAAGAGKAVGRLGNQAVT